VETALSEDARSAYLREFGYTGASFQYCKNAAVVMRVPRVKRFDGLVGKLPEWLQAAVKELPFISW